jgi:hypothetical protein
MHSSTRKLHTTDGPINHVDVNLYEIRNGNEQVYQLLYPLSDSSGEPSSSTIVLDHARVIVHVLNIYDVVPNSQEIPLGEVIKKWVRAFRRKIVRCSPSMSKLDGIKCYVDDKRIVSVNHIHAFFVYLLASRQQGCATPPPDYLIPSFAIASGQCFLHLPLFSRLSY